MYAYILGKKTQETVRTLESNSDISGSDSYTNLSEFLTRVNRRALVYDRIIILAPVVNNEQEFIALQRYLGESSPQTQVIIFGRGYHQDDVSRIHAYYNNFKSPLYTDYCLEEGEISDLIFLEKVSKESIDYIRLNHSLKKDEKPSLRKVRTPKHVSEKKVEFTPPPPCVRKSGVIKTFGLKKKLFRKPKMSKNEIAEYKFLEQQANAIMELVR